MALPYSASARIPTAQSRTHPLLFPNSDLLFPLLHTPLPSLDVNLVDVSARDLVVGIVVIRYEPVQLGFLVCGGAAANVRLYQASVHG